MDASETLLLNEPMRARLWRRLAEVIEQYLQNVASAPVAPKLEECDQIQTLLRPLDFNTPVDPLEALDFVAQGLWQYQVHTPHPRYFGFFNPAPTAMSIAADALVAAFNPQMATWIHSPLAIEIEQHLLRVFAGRFGFDPSSAEGCFTSGGAEANHTALVMALTHKFPEFAQRGLRSLSAQPVMYVSAEGHHSFAKAARLCGLGTDAVREVPVNSQLRMDLASLDDRLTQDKASGVIPFLVVGTAGTTSAGAIDSLPRLADLAARERLWFHVDAAWGGAAALVPERRPVLEGIERADSLTFDAHKWLSVPMGAGLFLTRHPRLLEQTFRVATGYMPDQREESPAVDPYAHSMQWSRRFIGLKVFLSLLVAGWEGYAAAIRHMMAMCDLLRRDLERSRWEVVNDTSLAVVCFVDRTHKEGTSPGYLQTIARRVVESGSAWIATVRLANGNTVLRACITNYRTSAEDVRLLVNALNAARECFLGDYPKSL